MCKPSHRRAASAAVAITVLSLLAFDAPLAAATADADHGRHNVDLVIALDVSDSMSELIESAKQRLWDIVNELGQAQPMPVLRVAILSYGNPGYGVQSGYVQLDLPFTSDLDAVNATLFGFRTGGGDEYVARVVHTALDQLQWSPEPEALRIVFVAGNESATQDPQYQIETVMAAAARKDVIVNALYCGGDADADAVQWRRVATLTQGFYAAIDQGAAAVANIATPMDAPLAALNQQLNATYLAYGQEGARSKENQEAQDANAAALSAPAAASRAVAKASALYRMQGDLVDTIAAGGKLDEIAPAALPAEMRSMDATERAHYLDDKAAERTAVQQQIAALAKQRRDYIDEQRASAKTDDQGLDTALVEALRKAAERKGFVFSGG
jgi:hypothetical protein